MAGFGNACMMLLCLSAVVPCHAADGFMSKSSTNSSTELLEELEAILGHGSVNARVDKLKARILPMFLSLPKRSGDLLSYSTTHYALHRINTDQHGWTINSTTPHSNTASLVAAGFLNDVLPVHILAVFEKHVSAEGFSLADLTILASTMSHFVHEDQKGVLRTACEFAGLPTIGDMADDDMTNLVKLYLGMFLKYLNFDDIKKANSWEELSKIVARQYPDWGGALLLVGDEREALAYNERHSMNPFKPRESSMNVALRVVERVADLFSVKHAEPGCQEIKDDLMEYERGDTGRLLLADFYRAGLTSKAFYVESKDYLQATGAIDDTDMVRGPKVIIPNYVQMRANCLAREHVYMVCCRNECEGLYGHLESSIAAAEGSPERITSLVAALSSSSTHAPRNLSQGLVLRLHDIAAGHGGSVILHSRLFAQWMHQAFPRECPYPHSAGTTTLLAPNDWGKVNGVNFRIDHAGRATRRDVTLSHIDALEVEYSVNGSNVMNQASMDMDGEADLMWTLEDEHFVEPRRQLLIMRLLQAMVVPVLSIVFAALALALVVQTWSEKVGHGKKNKLGSNTERSYTV